LHEAAPFLFHDRPTSSSGDAGDFQAHLMENRRAEAEGAAAPSA
jgi:hypothetical protein